MITETRKFIDVWNCNDNVVITPSSDKERDHVFEKGTIESPSIVPMTVEELKYVNSHTTAFKDGVLRFDPEVEDEVYEYLGIKKENVLTNEWIEDAIINPTPEKLQRIVDITSPSQFERVRGIYYVKTNADEDISLKVSKIIKARYEEIAKGKYHSEIVVTPDVKKEPAADTSTLEKKISEQNETIKQLQAMMAQLLAAQSDKTKSSSDTPVEDNSEEDKPKRGRKAKKATDSDSNI